MIPPLAMHSVSSQGGATGILTPPRRRTLPAHRRRSDLPPPSNHDGHGDSGGGGGGGGGDGRRDGEGFEGEGLGRLALGLALFGIGTLFLVLIAVSLLLRRPAPDWAAPGHALDALWISTAFLAGSSLAIEVAARRRRPGERRKATRWLALASMLGLGFLIAQVGLWWTLVRAGTAPSSGGYAAVFFSLTGLHALHVFGGLVFFAALGLQVARPHPAGSRPLPDLRLGAIYWHFMGGVWLVLFTLLYFVR